MAQKKPPPDSSDFSKRLLESRETTMPADAYNAARLKLAGFFNRHEYEEAIKYAAEKLGISRSEVVAAWHGD